MSGLLEELGIRRDEAIDMVVNRAADMLLHGTFEEETEEGIRVACEQRIRERVDKAVDNIALENVIPNVEMVVKEICLQKTNQWGEKKGEKFTFVEYLIQRAEEWMTEQVDYDGKSKEQKNSYNWTPNNTRIAHAIDRHLEFSIERAMETILKDANNVLKEGIKTAVEIKLQEVVDNISFKVGRR